MAKPVLSVFGLGYVGLSTSVCFASRGFKVFGMDVDGKKVNMINRGQSPIYELGLEEVLAKSTHTGLLQCTVDHGAAVQESDISFMAVGTPSKPDGSIDLSSLKEVSKQMGLALKEKRKWHLVAVKSTATPGTTDQVVKPIIESASGKRCGSGWGLCFNPEFLREGSAIRDTLKPNRIVIGEHDQRSGSQLEQLYRQFHTEETPPILRMSLVNAELVKYASNAFLAMRVSYVNQIANLCQNIPGADVVKVAEAVGLDPRIGRSFLDAGLGYGGSCFPKDISALVEFARTAGNDLPLAEATGNINQQQPLKAIELLHTFYEKLKGTKVAILGLAFKPNTDDMREAVSRKIINSLLESGAQVVAYDPIATENARQFFGDRITYAESALQCIEGADSCIIVTEWNEFRELRPKDFVERMRSPIVIDGRRIFDPKDFIGQVKFAAIGLGPTLNTQSDQ